MTRSSILLGKVVRHASRIRGGGSALPGLVVEKLDKNFLAKTLGKLPYGVVVVSGTNGKTTTVKIVTELLEGQGLKVFTNSTGSNFKRGVISAVVADSKLSGKLDADIAVLELDEAHAVHFVRDVKPRYSLLLNVMRDQLDRFGEIDSTAKLLAKIAQATTKTVVLNREDSRIFAISKDLTADVQFYGYDPSLDVGRDKIRQSYEWIGARVGIENTRVGDYNYQVNAGYSYLHDLYKSSESEFTLNIASNYKIKEDQFFTLGADIFLMNYVDSLVPGDV